MYLGHVTYFYNNQVIQYNGNVVHLGKQNESIRCLAILYTPPPTDNIIKTISFTSFLCPYGRKAA